MTKEERIATAAREIYLSCCNNIEKSFGENVTLMELISGINVHYAMKIAELQIEIEDLKEKLS